MHTFDLAPLRIVNHHRRGAQVWHLFSRISQFYLHIHTFIRNRNEPYLPLPSQQQLVLIYRPRRDGRLSRPWYEVAHAEIRTRNLPIANPALYHTATSAPLAPVPNSKGIPFSGGVKYTMVGKFCEIPLKSPFFPETVRDRLMVVICNINRKS